jgi:hypothetical protein
MPRWLVEIGTPNGLRSHAFASSSLAWGTKIRKMNKLKETSYNFLTTEDVDKKDETYVIITEILSKMVKSGVFDLGAGYCISMSDMVRTSLRQRGISSRLVEVTLTITYHNILPPDISFVGFDNINNPGEIDTHIVLITDTLPSYLIDASIPHRLPERTFAIVQPIKTTKNFEILNQRFNSVNISLLYEQKKLQHVPVHYQESIVERIQTDRKIFKNLGFLKILIIIALTIGGLNFLRGSYDFYQVYINDENTRGPSGIEMLNDRIDNLEKLMKGSSR